MLRIPALALIALSSLAAYADSTPVLNCFSFTPGAVSVSIAKNEQYSDAKAKGDDALDTFGGYGRRSPTFGLDIQIRKNYSGGAVSKMGISRKGDGTLGEDLTGVITLYPSDISAYYSTGSYVYSKPAAGTIKIEPCELDGCKGLRAVLAENDLSAVEMFCRPAGE